MKNIIIRNSPNLLSISRIFFIGEGLYLISLGYLYLGLIAVLVGFLTDFFDGWLARKIGQVSELGKIIDPLADIISLALVYSYFILQTATAPYIRWMIYAILLRNIFISIGYKILQKLYGDKKTVAVSKIGKFSSATQMIACFIGLMGPSFTVLFEFTLTIGFILSMVSGCDYLKDGTRLLFRRKT